MGILEKLKKEKKETFFFELTNSELDLLAHKMREDKKLIAGWIRPTRWDKDVYDREISFIDFYDKQISLRRTNETKTNFYPYSRTTNLSGVNRERNFPTLLRLAKIKKYYAKISRDSSLEDMRKIFGRLFYCVKVGDFNGFTLFDFVSNEKKDYITWDDSRGWYYNPKYGDKVLNWIDDGFTSKYERKCDYCGEREIIAYTEPIYKKVKNIYFCPSCLRAKNFGVCDISGEEGFRIKLKFSSKKDKSKVLRKLRLRKKEINVIKDIALDKGIKFCDKCGSAFVGENALCDECKFTQISYYGDKRYKFLKSSYDKNNEKLFFGTECEIEVNGNLDKCSKILNKNLSDMVYLKSDGSINHGFEIVSYAMTYKKWYSSLRKFKKIYQQVIDKGGYSESATTTGLHIHLSRDGFKNKEHLARFARCFYLDKDLTKEIACRDFNGYSQWNDFRASETDYFEQSLGSLYTTFDNRYHIVNFANEKTVEIRMFNGTLRADVIFAYLQFCKLLVDYSKINEVVDKNSMIKYLNKNAKSRVLRNLLKMYDFKSKFTLKEIKRCA